MYKTIFKLKLISSVNPFLLRFSYSLCKLLVKTFNFNLPFPGRASLPPPPSRSEVKRDQTAAGAPAVIDARSVQVRDLLEVIICRQGLLHRRPCKPDFLCSWPSLNSYLE